MLNAGKGGQTPSKMGRLVYEQIKRKLVLGHFRAGEAIAIRAIQDEIASSQVPIREALIQLAAEDLVEAFPGRGFFAKAYDVAEIMGNFDLISFFLWDAASFISADESRRDHLGAMLETDVEQWAFQSNKSDAFDQTLFFIEVVGPLYRRPHSKILGRTLFRCAHLLYIDALLSNDDLRQGTYIYLNRIHEGGIDDLKGDLVAYWAERKSRLPDILSYISNMAVKM